MAQKLSTKAPPDYTALANLYLQLARMEEAGISHLQAFQNLMARDPKFAVKFSMIIQYLKSGRSVSESGYRTGLFRSIDRDLIKAGELSGKLSEIYRQLAAYYGDKAKRIRQIKSRMFLPLSILFLALLIQPIPSLFAGSITVFDYLLASFGAFVYVLLVLLIFWRLPFWLTDGFLSFLGLRRLVFELQLTLPIIAPWLVRRQVREFLLVLGLMLEAGVPVIEALPKAADTVKNKILGQRLRAATASMQQGISVADSLAPIKEINRTALQLITSGEHSGKLPETLLHFVELEAEAINLQEQMLADWIPRFFYLLVTVWMGYSIIASYLSYFDMLDKTISGL